MEDLDDLFKFKEDDFDLGPTGERVEDASKKSPLFKIFIMFKDTETGKDGTNKIYHAGKCRLCLPSAHLIFRSMCVLNILLSFWPAFQQRGETLVLPPMSLWPSDHSI